MTAVSRRVGCLVMLAACVLFVPAGASGGTDGASKMPHVRTPNARILELIHDGCQRSPTFRSLFEQVEGSDLIVYVEITTTAPPDVDAWLQYEGTSSVNRFLRIFVKVPTSAETIISLLGHELQHATEVAAAPEVRDQRSLAALYRREGDFNGEGWDTRAARETTKAVREELRSAVLPASRR